MSVFTPGQRWISDGEAELGLGTILNCDARSVTVLFTASQQTRTYSARQTPLTRVAFGGGDRITTAEGRQLIVDDVQEVDGLLVYTGKDETGTTQELPEARIADSMQFNQARDRLLTGQIDRNDWFDLRFRTLYHYHRVEQNPSFGLAGPKIDLIPHQLYIADEVSRRHAPRVLLADEVGLGKTIEAGLILHRMLLSGRVERALILVPDNLTHQWLVELLRRFALDVTLLDESQSQAHGEANPFESGQLILASQQWLFANPQRQVQAQVCDWDLLIVDEAHHLDWTPLTSGLGYACVERLAGQIPGLLLLTATPEQMGIESHFARLRLLDPDRYHDLTRFRLEEADYVQVAAAIDALDKLPGDTEAANIAEAEIDDADSRALLTTLSDPESDIDQRDNARRQLREQLLDRHGTGRVMFRNSRRHVGGFPERRLHIARLELPGVYRQLLQELPPDASTPDERLLDAGLGYPEALLYPEIAYCALNAEDPRVEPWWRFDPRVAWLLQLLSDTVYDKLLVIVHDRNTAIDLAEALRVLAGIHAPVFHEGMTLVERDRAAASFADEEQGSPVMVCSEIGSEGRNFQFCRHLVMFDLPQHPDQLEQRIGRLDRIGQRHAIEIHVPVFDDSPGEQLLRWYQEGMDAFSAPHGVGSSLYDAFGDALTATLRDPEGIDEIVSETRTLFEARLAERDAGRNRLLELNACRPDRAEAVLRAIRELDEDTALTRYLDQALDIFGVDSQDLGDELVHLRAGTHMFDGLPGLVKGEEGFTATPSRQQALIRDDVHHLSWEHPLVREMMGRILDGTLGNTAVALLAHPAIPARRLMVELVFSTYCPAPRHLHINRFLPPTAIRVLLDEYGANLSSKVSFTGLAKNLRKVKKAVARDLIKSRHDQLRALLTQGENEAECELPTIIETAQQRMKAELDNELTRLKALAQHNPAVRDDEIQALQEERAALDIAIEGTRLRLEAVRVIVTVDENSRG